MKSIESEINVISIVAYLSPHPLDDEFDVNDINFYPGFKKDCDDVLLSDDNIKFYDKIENIVEMQFKKSMTTLWPLVKGRTINSIQICIDITGLIVPGPGIASYYYEGSDSREGKYKFFVQRKLLYHYLKCHYENEIELPTQFQLTMEHEIIHMLDDKSAKEAQVFRNSLEAEKIFKYYLINYRIEGIAELYATLKNLNHIRTIEEAKKKFNEELYNAKLLLDKITFDNVEQIKGQIYYGNTFYNIGPWLILDMMKNSTDKIISNLADDCMTALANNNSIKESDILEVVGFALKIDNETFLNNLIINSGYFLVK